MAADPFACFRGVEETAVLTVEGSTVVILEPSTVSTAVSPTGHAHADSSSDAEWRIRLRILETEFPKEVALVDLPEKYTYATITSSTQAYTFAVIATSKDVQGIFVRCYKYLRYKKEVLKLSCAHATDPYFFTGITFCVMEPDDIYHYYTPQPFFRRFFATQPLYAEFRSLASSGPTDARFFPECYASSLLGTIHLYHIDSKEHRSFTATCVTICPDTRKMQRRYYTLTSISCGGYKFSDERISSAEFLCVVPVHGIEAGFMICTIINHEYVLSELYLIPRIWPAAETDNRLRPTKRFTVIMDQSVQISVSVDAEYVCMYSPNTQTTKVAHVDKSLMIFERHGRRPLLVEPSIFSCYALMRNPNNNKLVVQNMDKTVIVAIMSATRAGLVLPEGLWTQINKFVPCRMTEVAPRLLRQIKMNWPIYNRRAVFEILRESPGTDSYTLITRARLVCDEGYFEQVLPIEPASQPNDDDQESEPESDQEPEPESEPDDDQEPESDHDSDTESTINEFTGICSEDAVLYRMYPYLQLHRRLISLHLLSMSRTGLVPCETIDLINRNT